MYYIQYRRIRDKNPGSCFSFSTKASLVFVQRISIFFDKISFILRDYYKCICNYISVESYLNKSWSCETIRWVTLIERFNSFDNKSEKRRSFFIKATSLYGKSQSGSNSGYKFDYAYICYRRRLFIEERKKYYEYYRKIQYDKRRYIKKKKTNRLYRTTWQKVKVYVCTCAF